MYYVIETEYVGPNTKQNQFVDTHKIEISTSPEQVNTTKEICIEGWCGTTNDWCVTAHGEYATIEAARDVIEKKFGEVRFIELYNADTDVVEMYKPGKYDILSSEETSNWSYEAIERDIEINTTDEDIAQLVADYEAEANEQGCTLDDDLEKFMKNRRQELREEDGAYLSIDMSKWPDTWNQIKRRLKKPDCHIESGWIEIVNGEIMRDSSDVTDMFSHEISGYHTASGNPEHVDIPVVWEQG